MAAAPPFTGKRRHDLDRPSDAGVLLGLVRLFPFVALPGLLAVLTAPHTAAAQTVVGQVFEHELEEPLEAVHLQLVNTDDQTVASTTSDADGRFRIVAPDAGTWRIRAELLGFGTATSETLRLVDGQVVTVMIRMGVEPIPIEEPVIVVGDYSELHPDIRQFHERRRRGERTGIGHFIYGEDLERGGGARASDLVRMIPGVSISRVAGGHDQVIRMRGGCVPAIYVDGSRINQLVRTESLDAHVNVMSIESVEVYRGAQQIGGTYFDQNGCGLVLVWTKRAAADPGPTLTLGRLAAAVGLVALLFFVR